YDRLGARRLVLPGAAVVVVSVALMAVATEVAPWWAFLVLHLMLSIGLALVFTPVFSFALGGLPSELYPHGSAMLGTVQQVAAAAGTALVIPVMSSRAAQLAQDGAGSLASTSGGVQLGLVVSTVLTVGVLALSLFTPGRAEEADLDQELDALVD